VDGKILPSCGEVVASVLKRYSVVSVAHYDRQKTVKVNGEEWALLKDNGKLLAELERSEPIDYLLIVNITHHESQSEGQFTFTRLGEDRKPKCYDSFRLSGSYR